MPKRFLLLLVTLIFLSLPVAALAAGLTDLWVSGTVPAAQGGEADGWDAVHWWYGKKTQTYYLFLPACANPNSLTLHFSGPEELKLDGVRMVSGQAVSLTPGSVVTVANGNKKYKLEVLQSRNVPALFIATESGSLDYIHQKKGNEEAGTLLMAQPTGELAYQGHLTQIKGRGNATFAYYKKPYQIKLADKTDLCGMGKHKTWILLANFHDNSLLRNRITFDMARAAGLQYTPESMFCDLYINHEYLGTYELCTKVQPDKSRVNIPDLEDMTRAVNDAELSSYKTFGKVKAIAGMSKGFLIPNNPEDITGGYLLELDYKSRFADEASGYTTKKGQPVVVKYPEYASQAQMDFISELIQHAENAFRAKDGVEPDTGVHYTEYIDLDSFAKKYLLEEIVKNYDGNKSSQYFFKQPDSVSPKLQAGPAWDYDSAYGNYAGQNKQKISIAKFGVCNDYGQNYYWFPALYRKEDFRWRVQELYADTYLPLLEILLGMRESDCALRSLDAYAAELEGSAAMNFKRWPVFNIPARPVQTGANYQENIDYIRNFLTIRMDFLNEQWLVPFQKGEVARKP